jgi:hypothetical protein
LQSSSKKQKRLRQCVSVSSAQEQIFTFFPSYLSKISLYVLGVFYSIYNSGVSESLFNDYILPSMRSTTGYAPRPLRFAFGSFFILTPALNCFSSSCSRNFEDPGTSADETGVTIMPFFEAPKRRKNFAFLASPPSSSAAFHVILAEVMEMFSWIEDTYQINLLVEAG